MKLSALLNRVYVRSPRGDLDIEVTGLSCDSRSVSKGDLFFAVRGAASDGHKFIAKALEKGAVAVVAESEDEIPTNTPCIIVPNARIAMAEMAASFYGDPTADMPLVGITGTNGKTTTTYIVEDILESAGARTAVLGTISYRFRNQVLESTHTTPESLELQRILRQLKDAGAQAAVMEVSSHSLEQHRVDGCQFDAAVFTNLTRDHLDYHQNMESYQKSKELLFSNLLQPTSPKQRRRAVINIDDPAGEQFAAASAAPVVRYSCDRKPGTDICASSVHFTRDGITGVLETPCGSKAFRSKLVGRFNLSNILAAAATGYALGLTLDVIVNGIQNHRPVPGRLELVPNDRDVTVLVDYAHTGDALENVLRTLREIATKRIITVFGCGGDRDAGKRPIMGEIAARLSDVVIVTSDNPRTEDPERIMAQIRDGILPLRIVSAKNQGGDVQIKVREFEDLSDASQVEGDARGFAMIEDRKAAIAFAARIATPGDIVLLAGKGHEDYQIIGTSKHHFDDREWAAVYFNNKEKSNV